MTSIFATNKANSESKYEIYIKTDTNFKDNLYILNKNTSLSF